MPISEEAGLRTIALIFVSAACFVACKQTSGAAPVFDGERAYRDLEEIVALGPRVSGTPTSAATRGIIRREVAAAGPTVREYSFTAKTPFGARPMVNVVGVVEGTRPEIIVLGNHYDTKYFPDFEFVGANDGGATTAWMMEMARALGSKREGFSIWLCWFDGEEAFEEWSDTDSLYGSRAMVDILRSKGLLENVKAMINVDMIGDCDLSIFRDGDAPEWLVKTIWDTASSLGYDEHFSPMTDSLEDDHLPFRQAGVPAINLIDFRYGGSRLDHERNWHTPRDRMDLVCAESLDVVGEVVFRSLEAVERYLLEHEDE